MTEDTEERLIEALSSVLLIGNEMDGLDDELVAYIAGMLSSKVAEDPESIVEAVEEVLFPFLESVQCPEDVVRAAEEKVLDVLHSSQEADQNGAVGDTDAVTTRKLQQGIVSMSLQQSEQERDASRHMWGMEHGVKAMANDLIDAHSDKTSSKDKRKLRKVEAEKSRKLLSSANDRNVDEDDGGIVRMNVRAFTANQSTDKKRDVLVRNVTVSLDNGTVLLESGELKFAYQRRYGVIGENGVGKLASLGFPLEFVGRKECISLHFPFTQCWANRQIYSAQIDC